MQGIQADAPAETVVILGKFCRCQILVSTTPLGLAACTLPVPVTLIAFRFLAPKTPPKPPCAAADAAAVNQGGDPGSCLSHWADADDLRPGSGVTLSDLLPFLAKSGPPAHHRDDSVLRLAGIEPPQGLGVSIVTLSLMMLIQTGLSALPSRTTPSHPASFRVVANLPPKLVL